MYQKANEILAKYFTDRNSMLLELAVRDAILYGYGFIAVDKNGEFTLMDAEETAEKANEITRNR